LWLRTCCAGLDFKQDVNSAEEPVVLRWILKHDITSCQDLAVLDWTVKQDINCG
jgi:hypothetical protein